MEERVLQPLQNIVQQSFSYGRAEANVVGIGEANRNARRITRMLEDIAQGLHLQIDKPENRRVITHDNGNAFAEIQLGEKAHFVMVRAPMDGRNFIESLHGEKPEITIISGPCLFSADAVKAIGKSGATYALTRRGEDIAEPIQTLDIDQALSLYEIEAITRLGNFIHDLAENNPHITKVALNIPEAEYYLFALDGYQKGYLTREQMIAWFDKVDQRHARQVKLLSKKITKGNAIQIELTSPLEVMKNYIREKVTKGEMPELTDLYTQFADPLWHILFNLFDITTWQDIIDLSYVHAELSVAKQKNANQPTFALVIENPTESKIFARAKQIVAQLQDLVPMKFNAVAMYPHELMIPVGDNAQKTMYHIEEQPGQRFSLAREIVGIYQRRRV